MDQSNSASSLKEQIYSANLLQNAYYFSPPIPIILLQNIQPCLLDTAVLHWFLGPRLIDPGAGRERGVTTHTRISERLEVSGSGIKNGCRQMETILHVYGCKAAHINRSAASQIIFCVAWTDDGEKLSSVSASRIIILKLDLTFNHAKLKGQ